MLIMSTQTERLSSVTGMRALTSSKGTSLLTASYINTAAAVITAQERSWEINQRAMSAKPVTAWASLKASRKACALSGEERSYLSKSRLTLESILPAL